ncbi:MAG TPA: polymer-forming cytoskeletal protein [bacterium]|nr:polymer-forming cytoskeletal protein [bacterium]
MFKSKDEDAAIFDGGSSTMNTIIGKDTTISGTMEVSGTLRVDGVVKGDVIVSDTVAVGPTGSVEANVQTKNAVISGAVKGNIHASERIELQAKANITGDLITKSLVIEQGAIFHGNCNMKQAPAAPNIPGLSQPRPEAMRMPVAPAKAVPEVADKTR